MTRREYLENKIEKRKEWAKKAKQRSKQRLDSARKLTNSIPFGQPILVGHHSEKHARNDASKIHNNMKKGMEEQTLADHHQAKASGLASQLEKTVFSDDTDAIEKLIERITKNEKEATQMVAINKAWRIYEKKGDIQQLIDQGLTIDGITKLKEKITKAYSWEKKPFPTWTLTNLRARIRTDKKRIEQIKKRQERTTNAENSGGVLIEGEGDYVRITFAEKPSRDIINALKVAGFCWGGGSWGGRRDAIPNELNSILLN